MPPTENSWYVSQIENMMSVSDIICVQFYFQSEWILGALCSLEKLDGWENNMGEL